MRLLPVEDVARLASLIREGLIAAGEIETIKVGAMTPLPYRALTRFLERQSAGG